MMMLAALGFSTALVLAFVLLAVIREANRMQAGLVDRILEKNLLSPIAAPGAPVPSEHVPAQPKPRHRVRFPVPGVPNIHLHRVAKPDADE